MVRYGVRFAFSLFSGAALACSSSSGAEMQAGSGGSAPSASGGSGGTTSGFLGDTDGACADFAASLCSRSIACKGSAFAAPYGGLDGCVSVETARCKGQASLVGSGLTSQLIAERKATYDGATCADLRLNYDLFPPVKGTLPAGSSCTDAPQCDSGHCTVQGFGCGSCLAVAPLGGSCTTTALGSNAVPCVSGSYCQASTMTCRPRGPVGSPCDSADACLGAAMCAPQPDGNVLCAKSPPPQGEGASCGAKSGDCDGSANLGCLKDNPGSSSGVCTTITLVHAGQACDVSVKICVGGFCQYEKNGTAACVDFSVDVPCNGSLSSLGIKPPAHPHGTS